MYKADNNDLCSTYYYKSYNNNSLNDVLMDINK